MTWPPSRGPMKSTALPEGRSNDPIVTRRWTVNGRFLAQRTTGVQRYGYEILMALTLSWQSSTPLRADSTWRFSFHER